MARKTARKRAPRKKVRQPRELKVVKYQTGKSNKKADKKRRALHPGKRKSKSGKNYWETRRNRSDRNRRQKL